MIEKLVCQYYTDDWEKLASHGGDELIHQCLHDAQKSVQTGLWHLLDDGLFHYMYLVNLVCTQTKGSYYLCMSIEKDAVESKKITLNFSGVSLFK